MVSFFENPHDGQVRTEISTTSVLCRFFQSIKNDQPSIPVPITISQGAAISNQLENTASPAAPPIIKTSGGNQQQLVANKKAIALPAHVYFIFFDSIFNYSAIKVIRVLQFGGSELKYSDFFLGGLWRAANPK